MEIKFETVTEQIRIGEVRWTVEGLLALLESLGKLQPGERIEATRSGETLTFVRVEEPKPGA